MYDVNANRVVYQVEALGDAAGQKVLAAEVQLGVRQLEANVEQLERNARWNEIDITNLRNCRDQLVSQLAAQGEELEALRQWKVEAECVMLLAALALSV